MFDVDSLANEDGQFGRCLRCNRRIWVESGCSPVCDSCDDYSDYDVEQEPAEQPDSGDEEGNEA